MEKHLTLYTKIVGTTYHKSNNNNRSEEATETAF